MVSPVPKEIAMIDTDLIKDAAMFLASGANIFIYCDIIVGSIALWPFIREEKSCREIVDTVLIFLASAFYAGMNLCYIVSGIHPSQHWGLALSYKLFGFTIGIVLSRKMTYRHGLYKRNWSDITKLRNLNRMRGTRA